MRVNPDNSFMRFMTGVFDTVVAYMLFLLCCVPVFTIGAAATALHSTLLAIANDTCSGVLRKFFGAFKDDFKLSTILWGIFALVGAIVVADVVICFGFEMKEVNQVLFFMRGITVFCVCLYTAMLVYTFAGVAKFEVTWKQALRNAIVFVMKFPLATLGILVTSGAILVCVWMTFIWGLPVIFVLQYLQTLILNSVFNKTLGIKKEKKQQSKEESAFYE